MNLPRRPRVSQTLLDLISSNRQMNVSHDAVPQASDTLAAESTPANTKDRTEALQAAPMKRDSNYRLLENIAATSTAATFPITPTSAVTSRMAGSHVHTESSSSSNSSDRRNSCPKSEERPTYAKVASSFELSPDVVEKIAKTEKLFTPIRSSIYPVTSASVTGAPVPVTSSAHRAADGKPEPPALLHNMASELGVSVDVIKAIVQKLGAML